MDTPLLIGVVGIVVVAAVAYLGWRREQRRREALRAFAASRGWTFTARDDGLVQQLRGDFPLFRAGDTGRQCRNLIAASSPSGLECLLFDYSYQERRHTGSGSNTTTTRRTVRHAAAVVTLPGWLPELRLGPENLLTRIAGAIGFGDIDVESAEFNRRFRVRAADRTHAFDILSPRMIEFLLDQRLDSWELVGQRLLVTADGRWSLNDYDQVVTKLQAFVDLVPDYVWSKHGGEAPR